MDKNQKGAQRSSPPRDSQGNQAPYGPLEEQAALAPITKKGSTTNNQVRNSPPQMVLASKARGERTTNPGGWDKGEYAGGRQERCDNYHHQFKQTN